MSKQSHSSLIGSESFKLAGQPVGFSVIDYWRFQFSNIWDMQDQIAEFIVAQALGRWKGWIVCYFVYVAYTYMQYMKFKP